MKVRIKPGNRYGEFKPGDELDVSEKEFAQHPALFEDATLRARRLADSQVTYHRLSATAQRNLGLDLVPNDELGGDFYEFVRLDPGVPKRAELAGGDDGARATINEIAKLLAGDDPEEIGSDPVAYVRENIGRPFEHFRTAEQEFRREVAHLQAENQATVASATQDRAERNKLQQLSEKQAQELTATAEARIKLEQRVADQDTEIAGLKEQLAKISSPANTGGESPAQPDPASPEGEARGGRRR